MGNDHDHELIEDQHTMVSASGRDMISDTITDSERLDRPADAKIASILPDEYRPFTIIPPDIVLSITECLSQDSQVLLSLTCKILHSLLNSCLDISIRDLDVRKSILVFLEIDHPEYLTCKVCGWMYIWERRRRLNFTCPRSSIHSQVTDRAIPQTAICIKHSLFMNHAIRDLILRAKQRGPQHGLPISFLNTSCLGEDQVSCKLTARVVNGRLILVSNLIMDILPTDTLRRSLYHLHQGMCLHRYRWENTTEFFRNIVSQSRCREKESVTAKCECCATDYHAYISDLEDGGLRIVLGVWQNYGDGQSASLDVKQLFHTEGGQESLQTNSILDPTLRDIETLFKSQEGEPMFSDICEHGEADGCSNMDECDAIWDAGQELRHRTIEVKTTSLH